MAKYLTIEMRLPNDVDVYDDATQQGLLDAVNTFEAVLEARVVGVGEGPDPKDEVVQPDNVATRHDPDGGEPIPVETQG